MGKRRLVVGVILITFILVMISVWLYLRPSETLDMNYTDVAWEDKLLQMVQTREPKMTLTEYDINQIAKQGLSEYMKTHELPFRIVGSSFHLTGDKLIGTINGEWGPIEFGTNVEYVIQVDNTTSTLILRPSNVSIRHISVAAEQLGLDSIELNLASYIPDFVQLSEVEFPGQTIDMTFDLDWMEIASYLNLL